jgi:outer membrane protein assembly factor BamB
MATKPLRLWPGVVAGTIVAVSLFGVPLVAPGAQLLSLGGGALGGLIILIWWLLFSRAPWAERLGALALMVLAVVVVRPLVHESISGAGMGRFLYVMSVPILGLALVVWAVATRALSPGVRRIWMVVAIFAGSGVFMPIRTGGVTGDGEWDLHWRWTPTPEERLLAQAANEPLPPAPPAAPAAAPAPAAPQTGFTPVAPAADGGRVFRPGGVGAASAGTEVPATSITAAAAEWPGFRGPHRDGVVRSVTLDTDWTKSPPTELWRRAVGPGWSSFAVQGDLIYTQEQRGGDEVIASYNFKTGKPVWQHKDKVRFYESNGGAGPRATPTISNGRVYALGATGVINALDAATGAVVWTRNAATDAKATTPGWGFSGSPLVVGDLVIVAASGNLVAYDVATGKPRWFGPAHRGSYSSPQLATFGGVAQIVMLTGDGATAVAPDTGAVLWEYAWEGGSIVQPAVLPDGVIVNSISMMGGLGVRRLAVTHAADKWTVEERWTSAGLKPYFNDFVVHNGHAYGFDGTILSCIDLQDGQRKWKGGRYGAGQLVLLPDQDLLFVLSEEGELALVKAAPDKFTEIARAPAIEGKTWNHPVVIGHVLLVRNDQEMAAFRLK